MEGEAIVNEAEDDTEDTEEHNKELKNWQRYASTEGGYKCHQGWN